MRGRETEIEGERGRKRSRREGEENHITPSHTAGVWRYLGLPSESFEMTCLRVKRLLLMAMPS